MKSLSELLLKEKVSPVGLTALGVAGTAAAIHKGRQFQFKRKKEKILKDYEKQKEYIKATETSPVRKRMKLRDLRRNLDKDLTLIRVKYKSASKGLKDRQETGV